jgi:hypothetical protein
VATGISLVIVLIGSEDSGWMVGKQEVEWFPSDALSQEGSILISSGAISINALLLYRPNA